MTSKKKPSRPRKPATAQPVTPQPTTPPPVEAPSEAPVAATSAGPSADATPTTAIVGAPPREPLHPEPLQADFPPPAEDAPAAADPVRPSSRRPIIAATLSFLWPGAGQAFRGRSREALLQAMPVALLASVAIAAVLALGPLLTVVYLFNPVVSLVLIAIVGVLGLLRAWSIFDALRPPWARVRRAGLVWATVLIALVVVSHAWVGWTLYAFYHAGQVIGAPIAANPGQDPAETPLPPGPTLAPGATPDPNATPGAPTSQPTGQPAVLPGVSSRVTLLLVGVDNTHGRDLGLTDTLIVASFDPQSQQLTMISTPRDTTRLPYYAGGTWQPRINALMANASRHPELYPDGPMGTLVNEMSYVVGVPIDYYAQIDIAGFSQLIDAVGGVDVTIENPVDDPGYQFSPTETGFHLDAGPHHLDGKYATAFARSRHGSSDYDRAARQQKLILALRAKLNDPQVLLNLPNIVDAASQVIRTNAPLDRLPEIISIAQQSQAAETQRYVLGPPDYAEGVFVDGVRTFQLQLKMDAVAQLSIDLFGELSRYARLAD